MFVLGGCSKFVEQQQKTKSSELVDVTSDNHGSHVSPTRVVIPINQKVSQIGKPAIIEGARSIGRFEIRNNCLVFVKEHKNQSGTVILGKSATLIRNRTFLKIDHLEIPLGSLLIVEGVIRDRDINTGDVHPEIPDYCPKNSILVGAIDAFEP